MNINKYKNNVSTWFGTGDDSFKNFYKDNYETNVSGDVLLLPRSTARMVQDDDAKYLKVINGLANKIIATIVKKYPVLRQIDFNSMVLEHSQAALKQAVCSAASFMANNQILWQRVVGSTIATGSVSINVDTSPLIVSDDIFGVESVTHIAAAEMNRYEIVGDAYIGDIRFDSDGTGITLIKEWNNRTLCTNLGEFGNKAHAIASITGQKRYDYFTVTDRTDIFNTYRWSGTEWEGFDTKNINENRYLVYDGYVLAGSAGRDGLNGKDGKDGANGKDGKDGRSVAYYHANFDTDWATTLNNALGTATPHAGDQVRIAKGNENYLGFVIDGTRNLEGLKFNALTNKAEAIFALSGNNMVETPLGGGTGAGIERVSTWTEFNAKMTDPANYGKLFYVEDGEGADDTKSGEPIFAYIENGTTYTPLRSWTALNTYLKAQFSKIDDTFELVGERIDELVKSLSFVEKQFDGEVAPFEAPDGSFIDWDIDAVFDSEGNPFDTTAGKQVEVSIGIIDGGKYEEASAIITFGSANSYAMEINVPDGRTHIKFLLTTVSSEIRSAASNFESLGTVTHTLSDLKLFRVSQIKPVNAVDLTKYVKKAPGWDTATTDGKALIWDDSLKAVAPSNWNPEYLDYILGPYLYITKNNAGDLDTFAEHVKTAGATWLVTKDYVDYHDSLAVTQQYVDDEIAKVDADIKDVERVSDDNVLEIAAMKPKLAGLEGAKVKNGAGALVGLEAMTGVSDDTRILTDKAVGEFIKPVQKNAETARKETNVNKSRIISLENIMFGEAATATTIADGNYKLGFMFNMGTTNTAKQGYNLSVVDNNEEPLQIDITITNGQLAETNLPDAFMKLWETPYMKYWNSPGSTLKIDGTGVNWKHGAFQAKYSNSDGTGENNGSYTFSGVKFLLTGAHKGYEIEFPSVASTTAAGTTTVTDFKYVGQSTDLSHIDWDAIAGNDDSKEQYIVKKVDKTVELRELPSGGGAGVWTTITGNEITNFNDDTKTKVRISISGEQFTFPISKTIGPDGPLLFGGNDFTFNVGTDLFNINLTYVFKDNTLREVNISKIGTDPVDMQLENTTIPDKVEVM